MVQVVVWGNNVSGNLGTLTGTDDGITIRGPTIIPRDPGTEIDSIIWASWACTILQCMSPLRPDRERDTDGGQ